MQNCQLYDVLKSFKEEFIDSKDKTLQKLAKKANGLLNTWKSKITTAEIDQLLDSEHYYNVSDLEAALQSANVPFEKQGPVARRL
jgi:hypothetical protein